jgi:hypothetical protein
MNTDNYTIKAEAKYRRVYQGTKYTLMWRDANDVEHTATSHNFNALQSFARNGFSKIGLLPRQSYRVTVQTV